MANEDNVTYALYDPDSDGDNDLGRTTNTVTQLVAENIQSLAFTYTLADGTVTATPGTLSEIRLIEVSLTGRTAKPDPQYAGSYRTPNLTMAIQARNMTAP